MSDMTLVPTSGFGGEAGAAGLGGAVGGLIGSWFGNGWGGGGGWGGRGGVGAAEGVVVQNSLDTNAILQAINASSLANIQGQNGTNLTVERAAASTFNGLTQQNTQNLLANVQGFAGLNTQIQAGTNTVANAICASETAALTRSFQAQLAAEKCCCETNLNIERQAEATRALIRDQFAQSQAVLICDLKSQLQESRFANSQLAQTAQLNCKINQVEQLVNFKLPTPPTPPTGCC
ncbi:hypothetical protein CPT_Solent_020 [Salmonella phage Solent]|nr:hypothetical protein CPTSergei_19 [Salmonella phage vB_SenS_Sergei]AXY86188.1 hypothetical protein CPT_Solent_020 [Salmonella phage Solent]EBA5048665.1 hypothetical protein [Salmonella enterica]EDO3063838.1 hypothetical protein [Salmonella enterica subsp. enterica serovar Anatum]EGC6279366.1 hypothetical protein [Salmonella enterica]